ncbi:outer membrane lipoprotein carrier protein LolA [Arthrobacter sp. NPDC093139]|uniref:LolA family protein n=1 Tax=Arthrobacter sp. NPDC093139 TaxID=3363945 RepID=UPI0038257455
MTSKWLRWMPAAAVPAVIAAGVLAGSVPASARDPLPDKTPAQVLAMIAQHTTKALSGTIEQTSELGLPDVPQMGPTSGAGTGSIAELLTGPHSARVYVDGPAKVRIQVMDRLAERDAVRQGNELWLYNSKDNTATHVTLPDKAAGSRPPATRMPGSVLTPEELAARMLAKIDSSTDVTVGEDVEVAGRAAYSLRLTPRSEGTLVESVAIAVDGERGLPLSVEIRARGQVEPAFRAAFSSLKFEAPDAGLFNFTPPPGATIKEVVVPGWPHAAKDPGRHRGTHQPPGARLNSPSVTGSGWESIVSFPARAAVPDASAPNTGTPNAGMPSIDGLLADPLLRQATVTVPGGRAISTSLLNVLLTDDGRVVAGSVPLERLQAAAAAR